MVFGVIVVVLRLLNTFVDSLVRKLGQSYCLSVRIALVFILLLIILLLLVIRSTLEVVVVLLGLAGWRQPLSRYLLRLEARCW